MSDFSVKQYLIDNKLATEKGEFITTDKSKIPSSVTWGLGPYAKDETMIYLCTTIHIMEYHGALDNLEISIVAKDDIYYRIYINEIDRSQGLYRAYEAWDGALRTLDYLIPYMAGSNVSYLAGGTFFEN